MFYVYILVCDEGRYYVGSTDNVEERLAEHNSKQYRGWTNRYNNWRVIHIEQFLNRTEAIKREREIKRMKGGVQFKALLADRPNPAPATNKKRQSEATAFCS
jgi:predicted GIY-YIG superfamily endonuclease